MPSFDTTVGRHDAPARVFYYVDCEGVIDVEQVLLGGRLVTGKIKPAEMYRLETEAEADYKKHCEDRATDCAISRYESQREAA